MQKLLIKLWLIIFFFSFVPWQNFPSWFGIPGTRAENVDVEGQSLNYIVRPDGIKEYLSPAIQSTFNFETLGSIWQGDDYVLISVRVQTNNKDWSDWKEIEQDNDLTTGDEGVRFGSLFFADKGTALQYKIELLPKTLDLNLIHNHGGSVTSKNQSQTETTPLSKATLFNTENYGKLEHLQLTYLQSERTATNVANAADNPVQVLSRSAWGADESLRFTEGWQKARDEYCKKAPWVCVPLSDKAKEDIRKKQEDLLKNFPEEVKLTQTVTTEDGKDLIWPKAYTAKVRKIVLHHSADDFASLLNSNDNTNSAENLSQSDYEARIRSMYYYHTIIRGWGDIGYNYVVDPLGNIYEGRAGGDRVVAAHVAWNNEGSVGVVLMGNYETMEMEPKGLNGVVNAVAYLAKKYNLPPSENNSFRGKNLPNVIGHRDLASTACPGGHFYDKLPQIRQMAVTKMQSDQTKVPTLGEVNQANEQYSGQYYSIDISEIEIPPTSSKTVRLRFKNIGTAAWEKGTYLEGCCSFDSTLDVQRNTTANSPNIAFLEQPRVESGGIGDFLVTFKAGYVEKVSIITLTPVTSKGLRMQSLLMPVAVNTPDYSYEFVTSKYPKNTLKIGEKTVGQVTLKNTGNIKWANIGDNAMILKPDKPMWRGTDFHPEDPNVMATMQESEVLPGQVAHFNFNLTAPDTSGIFEEYFTPYIRQVGYFKSKNMFFRFKITDAKGNIASGSEVQTSQVISLYPDQKKNISLSVTNRDAQTWTGLQSKTISLLPLGLDSGSVSGPATFDQDSVASGENVTMSFDLQAPKKIGRYVFSLLPRADNKNVFGKKIEVTLYVLSPSLKASLVEQSTWDTPVHPYQKLQVSLTFKNQTSLTWKKGEINLGKFYNRDQASPLYDDSWLNSLRPGTLFEDEVPPGEEGTFQFYVTPKKTGLVEDSFKPGLAGYGWLDVTPVKVQFNVVSGPTPVNSNTNNPPNISTLSNTALSNLYHQNVRIRLSFSNPDNTVVLKSDQGGSLSNKKDPAISLASGKEITLKAQSNQVTAAVGNSTVKGDSLVFIPTASGIVSITNWDHYEAWDTKKQYNGNRYAGKIEVIMEDGKLVLVNELPLETYLHGLAEAAPDTHPEKRKVLAILARTYALFYMDPANRKFPGKPYDGSDDPNIFQKYIGYSFQERSPEFSKAVEATKGLVVTYKGKLVKTPYFHQSDGRTRSAEEVWGWKDTPYLVSVPDPLCKTTVREGHGVGLSGCGAEAAAELGKKYDEIIKYYYTGVDIAKVE